MMCCVVIWYDVSVDVAVGVGMDMAVDRVCLSQDRRIGWRTGVG